MNKKANDFYDLMMDIINHRYSERGREIETVLAKQRKDYITSKLM